MVPKAWTVLVLDCNPDMSAVIELMIKQLYSCQVLTAPDIGTATALVQDHGADLILMDLDLGEERGELFIRYVQRQPALKECLIIIISELCWSAAVRKRVAAAGIATCVDKGTLVGNFRPTLRKALEKTLAAKLPEEIPVS